MEHIGWIVLSILAVLGVGAAGGRAIWLKRQKALPPARRSIRPEVKRRQKDLQTKAADAQAKQQEQSAQVDATRDATVRRIDSAKGFDDFQFKGKKP